MSKPLLNAHYTKIFKERHEYKISKRLNKIVNIPCPKNKKYESFFICSNIKGNEVDIDECGYIYIKDTIRVKAPWSSKLFREKKMNKELIIFCHDKFNRKLDCHEGRLFKVKMIGYEYEYDDQYERNKYYFNFKIIERIYPNGYLYPIP